MDAIYRKGASKRKKFIGKPDNSCNWVDGLGAEIVLPLKATPRLGLSGSSDVSGFSYNKVFRIYIFKVHCFRLKSHLNGVRSYFLRTFKTQEFK